MSGINDEALLFVIVIVSSTKQLFCICLVVYFFEMLVIITVKIYLSWMLNLKTHVKTVHKKIVVIVRLTNRKRFQTGPY